MGAIATGVVEGTISAASYAATETLAYGRDVSFGDVLKVGLTSSIMAGGMKEVMQSIGLCNCFIAGTLVATETGYVTIENIKAGDLVWAHDPETGETALKPVVQTFRNETTEWIHVTVNGETLTCTPEHPFYVPQKGWTSAIDLRAGDRLQLLNGEYVVVEQVQHELLESPETTYNFEVEDFHTYYVGDEPVLVHNQCVAKDGDFKAIVNEFNETEAPHAHILRNGKRVAKVGIDGNIIKGDKSQGVTRFVSKYRKLIIDGIKKYYPVKGG